MTPEYASATITSRIFSCLARAGGAITCAALSALRFPVLCSRRRCQLCGLRARRRQSSLQRGTGQRQLQVLQRSAAARQRASRRGSWSTCRNFAASSFLLSCRPRLEARRVCHEGSRATACAEGALTVVSRSPPRTETRSSTLALTVPAALDVDACCASALPGCGRCARRTQARRADRLQCVYRNLPACSTRGVEAARSLVTLLPILRRAAGAGGDWDSWCDNLFDAAAVGTARRAC